MYKKKNNLKKRNIFKKSLDIIKKRGLYYLFKKFFYVIIFRHYFIIFQKNKYFIFNGKKLKYFYNTHNYTYSNERIIEIPIILSIISNKRNHNILEVGNVLSHYVKAQWDILDKFEDAPNIINKDVVNYKPNKKYDLVVSISTLEHVGFDEQEKDDKKILKAISNLKKNCLKKNGKLIFTIPVGWNPNLDEMLLKNKIQLNKVYYYKKKNWNNIWEESTKEKVLQTKYAKPHIGANGIIIGVIKN